MNTDKFITFIETPIFEEDRKALLSDEEYQAFQAYMLDNFHLGGFIQHTGGCQKIRWKLSGNNKGKSGGVRIIYYSLTAKGKLYLLMMYPKSEKDNMNAAEKAILKAIVDQLKGD